MRTLNNITAIEQLAAYSTDKSIVSANENHPFAFSTYLCSETCLARKANRQMRRAAKFFVQSELNPELYYISFINRKSLVSNQLQDITQIISVEDNSVKAEIMFNANEPGHYDAQIIFNPYTKNLIQYQANTLTEIYAEMQNDLEVTNTAISEGRLYPQTEAAF